MMILDFFTQHGQKIIKVPAKMVVCPSCQGQGTELYGSMKGYAYSAEELNEDPDFARDMMTGNYDVTCSECRGRNVVPTPDLDRCNARQKRAVLVYQHYLRLEQDSKYSDQQTYWAETGTPINERY